MLSTRGALDTESILSEVVASRPQSVKSVVLMRDVVRMWQALGQVLRHQLLLGKNIAITHRTCGFYFTAKRVVTDGSTKYYARIPKFGFAPSFCVTYGLLSSVPRIESGQELAKLPIEYVAQEAQLPAQFVTSLLHEIFLWVGEAIFQRKLLELTFPEVASLLVKRENATLAFAPSFLADLFAIDSRKWPVPVRELAEKALNPVQTESRPATGASVTSSTAHVPRPSSTASSSIVPKPAFVSSAATGRLFSDIDKLPPRRPPTPQTEKTQKLVCQQVAPEGYTEESVYDVLSPQRDFPEGNAPEEALEPEYATYERAVEAPEDAAPIETDFIEAQPSTEQPTTDPPLPFYLGGTARVAPPSRRKRFAQRKSDIDVYSLLHQRPVNVASSGSKMFSAETLQDVPYLQ